MSKTPSPYREKELQEKLSALTSNDTFTKVKDTSLIISLSTRLKAMEKKVKSLKTNLADKDNQIEILTTCKSDLESVLYDHPDGNSLSLLHKFEHLQMENKNCKRQIAEMELFLADYGMEWVGYHYDENQTEDISEQSLSPIKEKEINTKTNENSVYFNIKIMMQRIKELNSLINYQHIAKNESSNICHFTSAPSMSITFYANGIFLKNGPLRVYKLKETKQFLRDILDAYFPSELKEEYPNGVILNATDCSDKVCDLGKMNVNAAQLINKLPSKIVRDGKIFDQGLKIKQTNQSDVICIDTPTAKLMRMSGSLLMNKIDLNGIDITTLRIKASCHNITLILKMNVNDTVAMVYELVNKYLQSIKKEDNKKQTTASDQTTPYVFELFTPFPKRSYVSKEEMQSTLVQVKLVPNATLFLRYIH